jgi:hypothetical protein
VGPAARDVKSLGRRGLGSAGATGSPMVEVTACQWGWRFAYTRTQVGVSGGLGRTPELVVPVGQPVQVRLHSDEVGTYPAKGVRLLAVAIQDTRPLGHGVLPQLGHPARG